VGIFGLGRGEGVVHGVEALGLRVPFEQREVHDPKRGEGVGGTKAELVAHFEAQLAEGLAGSGVFPGQYQQQVAGLRLEGFCPGGQVVLAVELVHRRLEAAVGVAFDVDQAFGADLGSLHELGQLVQLLAGELAAAFGVDAHDEPGGVEDREAFSLGLLGQLDEGHAEADVGAVVAVEAHGLGEAHARERLVVFDVFDLFEQVLGQPFKHVQHVFLFHERHFAVDLGELGLPVGAEALVAEAFDDLEIAVVSCHHEQLLEDLGRLGQSVELPRVEPRGHNEVAGAFRGGLDEHGGLDLDEVVGIQEVAGGLGHAMPQQEGILAGLSAQVEVAVFQSELLAAVGLVFDGERWGGRGAEHLDALGHQLDVACGQVGIFAASLADASAYLDDALAHQGAGMLAQGGVQVEVEVELGDAVAVAQVDEGHAAEVADALDPAA